MSLPNGRDSWPGPNADHGLTDPMRKTYAFIFIVSCFIAGCHQAEEGLDRFGREKYLGLVSPDGRWEMQYIYPNLSDPGHFEIWLKGRGHKGNVKVIESDRNVDTFWAKSTAPTILVVNDDYVTSHSRCFICNPDANKVWRVDLQAIADFSATSPEGEEPERIYSSAISISPDGSRLLLSIFGRTGSRWKNDMIYVLVTATGMIIRKYKNINDVPAVWWE